MMSRLVILCCYCHSKSVKFKSYMLLCTYYMQTVIFVLYLCSWWKRRVYCTTQHCGIEVLRHRLKSSQAMVKLLKYFELHLGFKWIYWNGKHTLASFKCTKNAKFLKISNVSSQTIVYLSICIFKENESYKHILHASLKMVKLDDQKSGWLLSIRPNGWKVTLCAKFSLGWWWFHEHATHGNDYC